MKAILLKIKSRQIGIINSLLSFFGEVSSGVSYHDETELSKYDSHKFIEIVNEARAEWIAAQNYFENVTDHDLVDHAIYTMEATQIKYMYLIKQAKIQGIKAECI